MPLQLTWKKIMTGALAFTLITGVTAGTVAIPTAVLAASSGLTTPFTDVQAGHWAEKHIAKLALQGIITGYEDKETASFTFRPSQNVSQQEAVLMALRFAGLVEHADVNAIIGFDQSFVVSAFFKPYIELAFNEGLLDRNEEYAIAAADTSVEWGKRPASREWVTKLIVKTIGEEELAGRLQNTSSLFNDANQADDKYKGYINAATQLNLVTGITQYEFKPKNDINRASLATLFSRAQKDYPIQSEGQTSGILTKLNDDTLTLYSNNKETSYTLSSDTLYYNYKSDTPITSSELLLYGDITVIAKNGIALYVEVQGDKVHTESVEGKFDRLNLDEGFFYAWINDKPVEIEYSDSVVVEDTEGKLIGLSGLKRDMEITIFQETFRESPLTTKIIASSEQPLKSIQGKLYSVDSNAVTITENGALVSKYLVPGVAIEISGLTNAVISDLFAGADDIELSLNDADQVTKIKVTGRDVKTLAGAKKVSYDANLKLLTIVDHAGKNPQVLYLTDKTKFEYMGNPMDMKTAVSMLDNNVNLMVSYTHTNVVSLKFVLAYTGTLTTLNTTDKLITLNLDGLTSITLPYDGAVVSYQGRPLVSVVDLKVGEKLTLNMKPDEVKVIGIQGHTTVQYEVISLNSLTKKLRLKNGTTPAFELTVTDAHLLKADGTKQSLSQFKAGTKLNASYVGTNVVSIESVSEASNG